MRASRLPASRAERDSAGEREALRVPDKPTIPGSLRAAAVDFYFNSIRLVPANLVWGIGLLGAIFLALVAPLLGLIALVALSLPTAGVFRVAALITRDRPVSFFDAFAAWRETGLRALVVGALIVGVATVLSVNVVAGATAGGITGWSFATLAAWGLVILLSAALATWPLLLDPLRAGLPLRAVGALAAAVVFSSPLRYTLLVAVVVVLVLVSTVAFAALISISVAFVALVLCRYVLPAADRLEGRATKPLPETPK